MKILFIHLSDIHCKVNTDPNNIKVEKMVAALKSIEKPDEVVLICTGDLAWSGMQNEYSVVKSFIGAIINKIKEQVCVNKYIHILLVPGNHDLNMDNLARKADDIAGYYSKKTVETEFNNELQFSKHFFEYAKGKKCFVDSIISDNVLMRFPGYIVQVNLLNTAPFSTLKNDNQGLHYFPDSAFRNIIKRDSVDLCITLMHHSTEWFEWDTKNKLNNAICRNSDIIFQGHDHILQKIEMEINNDEHVVVLKGGEFAVDNTHASQFSALLFNTENNEYSEYKFDWVHSENMFSNSEYKKEQRLKIKTNLLLPTVSFMDSFLQDNMGMSKSFIDYFVFPKLITKNNGAAYEKGKEVEEKDFFDLLIHSGVINITGGDLTGKTSLLKYLYKTSLEKGFTPLFLGKEDCKESKLDKVIQNLFEDQYGENEYDFKRYKQLDHNNRIIMIDDFDQIDKEKVRNNLLQYVAKDGLVVITTSSKFEADLVSVVKNTIKDKDIMTVETTYFYKEKRGQLIENICKTSKIASIVDIEALVLAVDSLVQRQTTIFNLTPEFIIQYIKYFLFGEKREDKGESIFSIIFETNIYNAIISHAHKNEVNDFLVALEEMAYVMHFGRKEKITYDELEEIVMAYNGKYRAKLVAKQFLTVMIDAKIFKDNSDEFSLEFYNKNYLAFFVARKINRKLERDMTNMDDINYILKNICFGINDTIVLFLSYIRNNLKLIERFSDEAEAILNEYEELNFDQSNIKFLKNDCVDTVNLPDANEKKSYNKQLNEIEEASKTEEIKYKGLYDYSDDDIEKFQYRLVRAVKCTQIVSKSLISLYSILEGDEKEEIIKKMFILPNKILFAALKPYDEHYNEVIKELEEFVKCFDESAKIGIKQLRLLFSKSAIAVVLSLYDDIAYCGADSKTIGILKEYTPVNNNNAIQKLMMEENAESTERFIEEAVKLFDDTKDPFIHMLIRMIAKKHIMTHEQLGHADLNRLTTKIFNPKEKKSLLLLSGTFNDKKG